MPRLPRFPVHHPATSHRSMAQKERRTPEARLERRREKRRLERRRGTFPPPSRHIRVELALGDFELVGISRALQRRGIAGVLRLFSPSLAVLTVFSHQLCSALASVHCLSHNGRLPDSERFRGESEGGDPFRSKLPSRDFVVCFSLSPASTAVPLSGSTPRLSRCLDSPFDLFLPLARHLAPFSPSRTPTASLPSLLPPSLSPPCSRHAHHLRHHRPSGRTRRPPPKRQQRLPVLPLVHPWPSEPNSIGGLPDAVVGIVRVGRLVRTCPPLLAISTL